MKGLKIVLWICAVCCLLAFMFGSLPWTAITAWFKYFGLEPPVAGPITEYVFRLCMAIFGLIGILFVILVRNALKYGGMLLLAGWGILFMGLFSLVGGIRYGFPIWTYAGDVIFCGVVGVLVFVFRKKAIQARSG